MAPSEQLWSAPRGINLPVGVTIASKLLLPALLDPFVFLGRCCVKQTTITFVAPEEHNRLHDLQPSGRSPAHAHCHNFTTRGVSFSPSLPPHGTTQGEKMSQHDPPDTLARSKVADHL
ncbi:hypothetical protein LshimejAT787_0505890 [Lyophyllum shimeji]|uniref:Uncharacterized protein n=1 Tax=Lyophyllum shimeji TaxID=47721 RepID=A0A9P3UL10_LYOSH|nr:hypothetical protein LshimejAT787_0505890 [Lyophyllum shimeji]